jgi:hypothetical protein
MADSESDGTSRKYYRVLCFRKVLIHSCSN